MKSLCEVAVDVLMRSRLYEMANSLQRSKDQVDSLSLHISEHLVKILLLPTNHRDRNHWLGEVQGALRKYRFKTFNNKYPTTKQYMEWFFDYGHDIDLDWAGSGVVEDMIQADYNIKVTFNPETLLQQIRRIMKACFDELSQGKYPNINNILKDEHVTTND